MKYFRKEGNLFAYDPFLGISLRFNPERRNYERKAENPDRAEAEAAVGIDEEKVRKETDGLMADAFLKDLYDRFFSGEVSLPDEDDEEEPPAAAAYRTLGSTPNRESAERYIRAYVESYTGRQGYYDFFRTADGDVFKLHYGAEYKNFRYMGKDGNTLVFDVDAVATIDGEDGTPGGGEQTLKHLIDDIHTRSYEDVIVVLQKKLSEKISPYFPSSVPTVFRINWALEEI